MYRQSPGVIAFDPEYGRHRRWVEGVHTDSCLQPLHGQCGYDNLHRPDMRSGGGHVNSAISPRRSSDDLVGTVS